MEFNSRNMNDTRNFFNKNNTNELHKHNNNIKPVSVFKNIASSVINPGNLRKQVPKKQQSQKSLLLLTNDPKMANCDKKLIKYYTPKKSVKEKKISTPNTHIQETSRQFNSPNIHMDSSRLFNTPNMSIHDTSRQFNTPNLNIQEVSRRNYDSNIINQDVSRRNYNSKSSGRIGNNSCVPSFKSDSNYLVNSKISFFSRKIISLVSIL